MSTNITFLFDDIQDADIVLASVTKEEIRKEHNRLLAKECAWRNYRRRQGVKPVASSLDTVRDLHIAAIATTITRMFPTTTVEAH